MTHEQELYLFYKARHPVCIVIMGLLLEEHLPNLGDVSQLGSTPLWVHFATFKPHIRLPGGCLQPVYGGEEGGVRTWGSL